MKKAFLLLIAVMTMTGTVWFNAGASGGSSIEVDVLSGFFMDAKAGQHVPAQLFSADGDLQELPCVGTENPGYVSCQFPESYAGQSLPIQLTKNGIMYVSVVNVPAQ